MDHETVNRWLASVALVLGIVLMLAVLYVGEQVRSGLAGLGGGPPPADPAGTSDCWDPGGGTVCAPGGEDGVSGD